MTEWGRPEQMRLDNGMPWGTQSTLPSAMGLWLVGLGIELRYGRPARSTDNAVVERSHGVLARFHFQRKVERNGQITLFANHYSAGRQYARQYIEIQLDASTDQWVMRDEYGHELRRQPAKELSYELISQLRLAKRRRP